MDPETLRIIVKDYCYQYVCQGEPIWPNNVALSANLTEDMLRDRVNQECEPVRVLINQRISLITLSSAPERAYKCLEYILNQYEDEHSQHHLFDVRRLPLPRLFTILPKPSVRWRFVTISANALSVFVRERLPRGYVNQLELFQRVFNFSILKNVCKR